MNDDSTFSVVVLPVPVPPETITFRRPTTHACRKRAACALSVPNRIRSSIWYGSVENFRMVRYGPPIASGWMIALTREPSGRRASTIGVDFVDAPADLADDLVDDAAKVRLVDERCVRLLDAAGALDEHGVGTVHHDFGDVFVLQEAIDRAVAEDVVGDVLDELGLVGGRQRGALLGECGLQLLVDAAPQIVLGEPTVVEDRAQRVDQMVVDLLPELVEDRVTARARRTGRGLHLVEPLVERHRAPPESSMCSPGLIGRGIQD